MRIAPGAVAPICVDADPHGFRQNLLKPLFAPADTRSYGAERPPAIGRAGSTDHSTRIMPLYYRCKSCGDEHLSPIVFPDRRSYARSHLTRNLFVCPGNKGAARYGKVDLYWRTDLPTQPARTGAGSVLRATPASNGRIMIVDDEDALVWSLEKLLQQSGYSEIATLTDSRNTIPLFESFRPDVLLLDLQMPYLDGYAILRALKPLVAGDPNFPILVMTGEVQAEAKLRALQEGARDFVTKPFEQVEVLLRVKALLEMRTLHRTVRAQARMLERRQWEEGRARELLEAGD